MFFTQKLLTKNRILFIALLLFLSFLAFLAVRNSFNLALGGDDWGIHYLIWGIFDVRKEASYFNPFTYFCTYCPHYFFLSLISRVFGYEPFYYFFANYLARIAAGLALYILLIKITKNTLIAFLASCFFVVTYLGIEATDWAFNYNHILGIATYSFFLIFYYKLKETPKAKYFLISGLLFTISLIISPPRMHGMLALGLVAELGWLLIEGKRFNLKQSILRILMLFSLNYAVLYGVSDLYLYLRDHFRIEIGPFFIGNGYGAKEWNAQRVRDGINLMLSMFRSGKSDFIIDPIATVGNYIMPDMLWTKIPFSQFTILGKQAFTFFSYILPISLIYGGMNYAVAACVGLRKKNQIFLYILSLSSWMLFIYFLEKINMNTFSYPRVAFAIIGGFSFISTFWLFFLLKKTKPILAHLILLTLGWMFTFIIFPWVIDPNGIIFTWGRYSIQQGAGVAIWMSVIFYILIDALNKKKRFILLSIVYIFIILFVFMHIKFSNDYLSHVETYRNKQLDATYWNYITTEVPQIDNGNINVFLMLTDQQDGEIAEALRFGFYGRASIYYKAKLQKNSPFMIVNEYENALSSVYDGKYLLKQGREAIPTTIDRVYAFALQNKQIYNVTDQVRTKLKQDLEAVKQGSLKPPQPLQ